ncbi:MAG: hypothetical protein R2861_10595 [Desulfobacterales bacterium]
MNTQDEMKKQVLTLDCATKLKKSIKIQKIIAKSCMKKRGL